MNKSNIAHSEMPQFSAEERSQNIIIKLVNFRSYGDAEIKIPLNAVTLINGPSGVGKTTILEAFIFIMYNGIKNPERFETKRCWGWLFIKDLIIYRQKDPILLKVWKTNPQPTNQPYSEYTGDDAQRVINSIYGTMDIFFGCSYLRQKEISVFLNGTDAEKLSIVKTIAMKGTEVDELKEPIKRKVAELQEQCTMVKAQLDMAIKNIQIFDQRNPNIVQYQVPENSEDVMHKVRQLRVDMDGLDKEFEIALHRETSANVIKKQMDITRDKKSQMEATASKMEIGKLKQRLDVIENKLKEYTGVSFDAEKLAKAQLFKIWSQEISRIEHKLREQDKELEISTANIRRLVPAFPAFISAGSDSSKITPEKEAGLKTSLEMIEANRPKYESAKLAMTESNLLLGQMGLKTVAEGRELLRATEEELLKAQNREKAIRADLEKSRQANKMKCPQCQTVLIVSDDGKHLDKCADAPSGIGAMLGSTDKTAVTPAVSVSHDDLVKAASLITSIVSKRDRLVAVLQAAEEKMKFDIGSIDIVSAVSVLPLFAKYVELKLAGDALREALERQHTNKPEEITEKIADSADKNLLENEKSGVLKSIENYELLLKAIESEETNIQQYGLMWSEVVKQPGSNSIEIKKKKFELQGQIDQLMHLSSASDLIGQRSILEKTMREKAELAQLYERKHAAAKRLLDKTVEAERISLETAVAEINTYLNQYLKRLFITSPISVSLSTTTALKSKKDSVSQRFDVKIFYNNAEYGSSKQLSGGEKDRLSLAITLAMSQKFGGSLLFLDETLSSLDPELKSEAVTLLKELSANKTILCVSHDETEGVYNHVMRIRGKN